MVGAQLTLGPVLFNWSPDLWRDFYYRIADETPIDTVYIGEVICSKRSPFFEPLYADVAERLTQSGKRVVFSTLAEVMIGRERNMVTGMCGRQDFLVEANDASALYHLRGKPHAVGPFINCYNEETLAFLAAAGATHVTVPFELPEKALRILSQHAKKLKVTLEVMVYGRVPLAISARCYHARAHDRIKDNCQFVCEQDPDGMVLKTFDGKDFLTVNGVQTLSHPYLCLLHEMAEMTSMGVTHFRLSPHTHDMVKVATLFRSVLDKPSTAKEAISHLRQIETDAPFANGFFHGQPGHQWIESHAPHRH